MILVSGDRSESNVVRHDARQIQTLVSRQITTPVTSFIAGQASIDRALTDASVSHLLAGRCTAHQFLVTSRFACTDRSRLTLRRASPCT
jgi:hypothetical protein